MALAAECDKLAADIERYRMELELSRVELARSKNEVEGVKKRLKEVWRMNCDQTISYDEEMAAKDAEIAELKEKLSAAPGTHCRSDNADLVTASSDSLPRTTCGASGSRRGKAPTVNPFSGDDGVTHFDDWLLSLERASLWNAWTDEEKLLQLAGHLRGRALQEWNLIPTDDRSTFANADKLHMAVMA